MLLIAGKEDDEDLTAFEVSKPGLKSQSKGFQKNSEKSEIWLPGIESATLAIFVLWLEFKNIKKAAGAFEVLPHSSEDLSRRRLSMLYRHERLQKCFFLGGFFVARDFQIDCMNEMVVVSKLHRTEFGRLLVRDLKDDTAGISPL